MQRACCSCRRMWRTRSVPMSRRRRRMSSPAGPSTFTPPSYDRRLRLRRHRGKSRRTADEDRRQSGSSGIAWRERRHHAGGVPVALRSGTLAVSTLRRRAGKLECVSRRGRRASNAIGPDRRRQFRASRRRQPHRRRSRTRSGSSGAAFPCLKVFRHEPLRADGEEAGLGAVGGQRSVGAASRTRRCHRQPRRGFSGRRAGAPCRRAWLRFAAHPPQRSDGNVPPLSVRIIAIDHRRVRPIIASRYAHPP